MADDDRYRAGALWELPCHMIVQLVYLDDTFALSTGGLAHADEHGKVRYQPDELPERLAGSTFLGRDDGGGWLWFEYAQSCRMYWQERRAMKVQHG